MSLPSWERGLKFTLTYDDDHIVRVAPLVGAWIEIGAHPPMSFLRESLPSWERGLKFMDLGYDEADVGRSPRGSVD